MDDDVLPAYYAAADVFLFPTLTTIECLGLTFVQAMFSGTLVIATRIAGAPEVIRDGGMDSSSSPATQTDLPIVWATYSISPPKSGWRSGLAAVSGLRSPSTRKPSSGTCSAPMIGSSDRRSQS